MRVFVVGASGVIGARLVPQLIQRGHEVIGSARSPEKAERLRTLGAEAVVLDALDARAVREAVAAAQPDAIVHQATALTGIRDFKHFDRTFALTNRLRTEGTDNLLAAAREAGVGKVVAQSNANHRYARVGGPVKSEDAPLDRTPVAAMRESVAAMEYVDKAVTAAGGIALRYGIFYGEPGDGTVEGVRARSSRSWATVAASGRSSTSTTPPQRRCSRSSTTAPPSTTSSTTSPPRPACGCRSSRGSSGPSRPSTSRAWLARLFAGEAPVVMATESRGASNAKAKRELGWTLRHPTWRQGFVDAYAQREPSRIRGPSSRSRRRRPACDPLTRPASSGLSHRRSGSRHVCDSPATRERQPKGDITCPRCTYTRAPTTIAPEERRATAIRLLPAEARLPGTHAAAWLGDPDLAGNPVALVACASDTREPRVFRRRRPPARNRPAVRSRGARDHLPRIQPARVASPPRALPRIRLRRSGRRDPVAGSARAAPDFSAPGRV